MHIVRKHPLLRGGEFANTRAMISSCRHVVVRYCSLLPTEQGDAAPETWRGVQAGEWRERRDTGAARCAVRIRSLPPMVGDCSEVSSIVLSRPTSEASAYHGGFQSADANFSIARTFRSLRRSTMYCASAFASAGASSSMRGAEMMARFGASA